MFEVVQVAERYLRSSLLVLGDKLLSALVGVLLFVPSSYVSFQGGEALRKSAFGDKVDFNFGPLYVCF